MWKYVVSWTVVSVFFIGAQIDQYGRTVKTLDPSKVQIKTSSQRLAREFTARADAIQFMRRAPIKIGEIVSLEDYVKEFALDSTFVPVDTLKQPEPKQ